MGRPLQVYTEDCSRQCVDYIVGDQPGSPSNLELGVVAKSHHCANQLDRVAQLPMVVSHGNHAAAKSLRCA